MLSQLASIVFLIEETAQVDRMDSKKKVYWPESKDSMNLGFTNSLLKNEFR